MDKQKVDLTVKGGESGAADTWPVSAREAAATLGVSERTVRRAISRGELAATKQAGVFRIAPADLARYRARSVSQQRRARPAPFQLLSFPERETAGTSPLPRPRSILIGRERELYAVRSLLL